MADVNHPYSYTSQFFDFSASANCSLSGSPRLSPWHVAGGGVIAVSCLLGLPANAMVLAKLSWRLCGSSASKRLFFHLALSDFLSLLCLLSATVILAVSPHLSHHACRFFLYAFFFCNISSLNVLVLISVQRYLQILHPAKWQKVTRLWQRFLLSSVWTLAALLSLPVAVCPTPGAGEWNGRLSCSTKLLPPALESAYILLVLSAHVTLLLFYLLLFRGLKQVSISDRKVRRVSKLFRRIIAVSLLGFLPAIARVVSVAGRLNGSEHILCVSKYLTVIECLYFLSYCLNPLLYFFTSRHQIGDKKRRRCFLMGLNDGS